VTTKQKSTAFLSRQYTHDDKNNIAVYYFHAFDWLGTELLELFWLYVILFACPQPVKTEAIIKYNILIFLFFLLKTVIIPVP